MKRRIVAYKNYYKDFFESLDAGTQEKILYGMHLNWKQNMKKANDIEMFDVDAQLDAVFGKEGSPERAMAEERANAFFTGQIIEDARKRANITQEELAQGAQGINFLSYRCCVGFHCRVDSCCFLERTAKIS